MIEPDDTLAYDIADSREQARDRTNDLWQCSQCLKMVEIQDLRFRDEEQGRVFCPHCGSSRFEEELL